MTYTNLTDTLAHGMSFAGPNDPSTKVPNPRKMCIDVINTNAAASKPIGESPSRTRPRKGAVRAASVGA